MLAGLLSGATTNTPSLAAAQQALKEALADPAARAAAAKLPALGYAVAYPFGVLGIILVMVGVRAAFRVSIKKESDDLERSRAAEAPPLARANLEVVNPNLEGMALEKVPSLAGSGIVVSRVWQDGTLQVPRPETRLRLGDVLLAVGTRDELDALRVVVGKESSLDLRRLPSAITSKRLIVTRTAATGKTVAALDFARRFGVQITRVSRTEVEMSATPDFELQYGDTVLAVGEPGDIQKVAGELGDSPKSLNYPHLIPMFAGIALGIVVGSWPFSLPGVPAPVRLGLAGGPLLVAIALARIGKIGPLVWYMPMSANYALRETGIVLFLAAVGLGAGDVFVETLVRGDGLYWMACGVGPDRRADPGRGRRGPPGPPPQLPDALRPAGGEHDRPAGPVLRDRRLRLGGAVRRLRDRLPPDDDPARPVRTAAGDVPRPLTATRALRLVREAQPAARPLRCLARRPRA